MAHFISESTVHEYQYSIEHFPETSSLMTSGSGTNYDFSICSRSSHSFLSSLRLKELWTLFPDVVSDIWKPLSTDVGRIMVCCVTCLPNPVLRARECYYGYLVCNIHFAFQNLRKYTRKGRERRISLGSGRNIVMV